MPDRPQPAPSRPPVGRLRRRGAILAGLLALAGAPLRAEAPDQLALDLAERLATVAAAARTAGPGEAAGLIAGSGVESLAGMALPWPGPVPGAATDTGRVQGPATVGRLPMRLALTMLSQSQGEEGNGRVVAAQSDPDQRALAVMRGRASLDDLRQAAAMQGLPTAGEGGVLEIRVPVVVWPGASLEIGAGEELRLSRPDGAFLASFGDLRLLGGAVVASGVPNPRIPSFSPFVVVGESGTFLARGARLEGLGFGSVEKFSGLAILRGPLARVEAPAQIVDSVLDGLVSVTLRGEEGALLQGNLFRDARGAALVVARSDGADLRTNLFSGGMPTNAIRVAQDSDGVVLSRNVVLGGDRAGIVVRDGSDGAVLSGNVVWDREGSGLLLRDGACAVLEGNLVLGNAQKGVELRGLDQGFVLGNLMLSNETAGLWVADQDAGAETTVLGNRIAWNGAGLASAGATVLRLEGNDMSGQLLQLLAGDLAAETPLLAADLLGRRPLAIGAAGTVPESWPTLTCGGGES